MVTGTTLGWDWKVRCILAVCNLLVHWFWNEYGEGWAEGTVTLGQGDRSGQVCVCVSVHLCVSTLCQDSRGLVRGYQWPSLYPSPLCPSISLSPPVPTPISHQWAVCPSIRSHAYFVASAPTNTDVGGFIHELRWDSVQTLVRNNINASCVL